MKIRKRFGERPHSAAGTSDCVSAFTAQDFYLKTSSDTAITMMESGSEITSASTY